MSSITTSDGRRLSYRRFGSGPPLVAHPGGPGYGSGSLRDLGGLDDSHDLLIIDPRGAGGSDAPHDDDYSLAAYADDLDLVVSAVEGRPRAVIGHSHGGMVAIVHAAKYEDVGYDRLVLVDTPSHLERSVLKLGGLGSSEGEEQRAVERLAQEWLRIVGDDLGEPEGPSLGDGDVSPAALRYFAEHQLGSVDLRPLCGDIDVPVLVVCGRHDTIAGPDAAADLAGRLPDARLAVVEDAAHVPYRENPAAFRSVVEEFLAS